MSAAPVVLRMAHPDDAPALAAIYTPYVADTIISFETTPPSAEEIAARVTKSLSRFAWIVAEMSEVSPADDPDSGLVGYAYASQHRERLAYQWSVDVSVYLHKDWHGRGVGRTLYRALFAMLRMQGYFNAYAGIALPNAASVGLHEAMGMTPVGIYHHVGYKAGAWHDVGWWEGALQPIRQAGRELQPPRALLELASLAEWDAWLAAGEPTQPVTRALP